MKRSVECPQCRKKVTEVKKNATLNNLIEKYLDKHPDMKRPQAEIEELEKVNRITVDIVEVTSKSSVQPMAPISLPQFSSGLFSSGGGLFNRSGILGFSPHLFSVMNPQPFLYNPLPQPAAPRSPESEGSESEAENAAEESEEPEEENAEESKVPLNFVSPVCSSCLQMSAARSDQVQTCTSCNKFFCLTCISKGGITKLRSKAPSGMNLGSLNSNIVEQRHLARYISSNGLTFTQVYENLLSDLVASK